MSRLDLTEMGFLEELEMFPSRLVTLNLLGDWYEDHDQHGMAQACWWLAERSLYPWRHPTKIYKPWFFAAEGARNDFNGWIILDHACLPREIFVAIKERPGRVTRMNPVRFSGFYGAIKTIAAARKKLRGILTCRGEV
jgi:hypothetical protein